MSLTLHHTTKGEVTANIFACVFIFYICTQVFGLKQTLGVISLTSLRSVIMRGSDGCDGLEWERTKGDWKVG